MPPQKIEIPFWPMAGAVAVGSLIAAAIVWLAVEVRVRWELNSAAQALRDATAAMEAESVKQQQAAQMRSFEARRQAQATASAQRDRREGRYLREATSAVPVGELACLAGSIVKREANGWQQQFDGAGSAIKCRTNR